jgi:hypothetical protein
MQLHSPLNDSLLLLPLKLFNPVNLLLILFALLLTLLFQSVPPLPQDFLFPPVYFFLFTVFQNYFVLSRNVLREFLLDSRFVRLEF